MPADAFLFDSEEEPDFAACVFDCGSPPVVDGDAADRQLVALPAAAGHELVALPAAAAGHELVAYHDPQTPLPRRKHRKTHGAFGGVLAERSVGVKRAFSNAGNLSRWSAQRESQLAVAAHSNVAKVVSGYVRVDVFKSRLDMFAISMIKRVLIAEIPSKYVACRGARQRCNVPEKDR